VFDINEIGSFSRKDLPLEGLLSMIAPPEFARLTHCFLQDEFNWGVNNETEWIRKALRLTHLPPSGIEKLKHFLDQLLAQDNDNVIRDVWWSTCPSYFVSPPAAVRELIKDIRQQIDLLEIKGMPGAH
jgi:hypothetical protein